MVATIQSTDLIVSSGAAFSIAAAGDSFWLTEGTILATRVGTALFTAGGATILIDGQVFGASAGLYLDPDDTLVIGATGSVASASTFGNATMVINPGGASVTNYGEITSTSIGIVSSGNSVIENTGRIYGRITGVFMGLFNAPGDVLINSGTILSARRLSTEPSEARFYHAVQVEGGNSRILNYDLISATDITGAGVHFGGGAAISAYGGAGSVLENYGTVSSAQYWGVDLSDLFAGTASVINYGTISGGTGGYRGSNAADVLTNRGTIQGDVVLGLGADSYVGIGGVTNGTVFGDGGDDTLTGGSAGDTLHGGAQNDTLRGGGGEDLLFGDANDDLVYGGTDDDSLDGGDGNDQLNGNAGDDILLGGKGNDRLIGGTGDDRLAGGIGVDVLIGGAGADIFVFGSVSHIGNAPASSDRIADFQSGVDDIDLSAIKSAGGADLTYIGSAAFTGVWGQLRYAGGLLQGDLDGDAVADFTLIVNGGPLVTTDFILG